MTDRVIRAFFDARTLSPSSRRVWTAAILLAPVVYAGGLLLSPKGRHDWFSSSRVDRAGAIRMARQFAAERGVKTDGWSESVRVESDADVARYLKGHPGKASEAVERIAPTESLTVALQSRRGRVQVRLTMDGKLLGYSLRGRPQTEPPPATITSEAAARAVLESHFSRLSFWEFGKPETSTLSREGGHLLQQFKWRTNSTLLPELEISEIVDVRDGQVVGERTSAGLSDEYREAHLPYSALLKTLGWFFVIYVLVLVIVVLVRYIRRTLQKEISHARTVIIAAAVAVTFTAYIRLSDQVFTPQGGPDGPAIAPWIFQLIAVLVYLILGAIIGISYSASEGDLREYYPGKLTSVDAILSGRFNNRNSAASILIGLVIASWMLLLENATLRTFGLPSLADSPDVLGLFFYSRAPALMLLVSTPISAIMESLTLLLPISLLQRWAKRPSLVMAVLVPLAFVSSLGFTLNLGAKGEIPFAVILLVCTVKTAGLLIGFFAYDVLACVVGLCFFGLSTYSSILLHSSTGNDLVYGFALAILAAVVALLVRVMLRAPEVRDQDVRPRYAGRIAERLFLEAEVTAAREAQLRLLPPHPPQIDGLSICASCEAADEVGGDFYDFFRLSPHRLAVLVSDGGGRGLEAALSIALAKGYLMQKAHSGRSPLETLRSLRSALGSAMDADESSGFCYIVLDLEAATFEYARHGPSPCVVAESAVPEALVDGSIFTGSGGLADGTRIIIYTDGIGARLRRPGKSATDRWIQQVLAWHRNAAASELSEAILREVFSSARRGRTRLEDDITLVVLAVEKAGARSMGHVA